MLEPVATFSVRKGQSRRTDRSVAAISVRKVDPSYGYNTNNSSVRIINHNLRSVLVRSRDRPIYLAIVRRFPPYLLSSPGTSPFLCKFFLYRREYDTLLYPIFLYRREYNILFPFVPSFYLFWREYNSSVGFFTLPRFPGAG